MSSHPPILNYADPALNRVRRWPWVLWRLILGLLKTAWVLIRILLLTTGFCLTVTGTILLILGGQQSASREIRAYGRQVAGVLRQWRADLARPMRQWWAAYLESLRTPAV